MLKLKTLAPVNVMKFDDVLPMQTEMSGGSSDTELKELAVKPAGLPSTVVVTTVTPVTNAPSAVLKSRGSMASVSEDGGFCGLICISLEWVNG